MPLRNSRWAGTIGNLEGVRTRDASNIYRQFSSISTRERIRSNLHKPPSIHLSAWRTVPHILKPFGCFHSKRFASTDLHPPANVDSSPVPVPVAQPVEAPTDQFISYPLDSITAAEYPRNAEYVGYLKDLGLDYGWGPTALMQTLLEYVHIYSGTGWGLSIVLTSVAVRFVLLKTYINASDVSARTVIVAPIVAPLKARLKEARDFKDVEQMTKVTNELRQLYRTANIKMWKVFVPMLNIPLGYGNFRLLRGMADLPVPGLDSAGFLWLTNLSQSDPYFILPLLTGTAFHFTFKKGGELASSAVMSEAMKKTMVYGIPVITSVFMIYWPGALQLAFATTSLLSLSQSYLLRQPWMRNFLNIQPLPGPQPRTEASRYTGTLTRVPRPSPPPSPPPLKKSFLGGAFSEIKGAASEVVKTARKLMSSEETKSGSQRRTPAELKRAQEYEEKRREEIAQQNPRRRRNRRF